MITLTKDICASLEAASSREWLEANGIGGYASSSVAGMNTRRYHGLLVAATKPPVGRAVLLSRLEETLVIDGERYDLSTNQYPGAVHPEGYKHLVRFRLDPFPVFTFVVGGIELEKSIFMIHGENSTAIQYEIRTIGSSAPARHVHLEVRPLVAGRDYHSLMHESAEKNPPLQVEPRMAVLSTDVSPLFIAHNADGLNTTGHWYRNFEYAVERERGFDYHEDLYNPFELRFDLDRRISASIIASTERRDVQRIHEYRRGEIARRERLREHASSHDELNETLTLAADQFIVSRGAHRSVIAGYHWFSDWGRDTMIALPGLTLATGRLDIAKSILLEFAAHVSEGMLPNRFPDSGEEAEYNTVDATLWYIEAVRALLAATDDEEFIRIALYPVLTSIIDWHVRGTRYGIRVDRDGLLTSGEEGVQLTWMDAKVGDWVVTPRRGKPVEIQALWYNALCVMEDLARRFNDPDAAMRYRTMAVKCRRSFNDIFWNEKAGCLYDVINGDERDASIRPNQIFAVSLHHSMLADDRAQRVVSVVEEKLLTPYGLRSLAAEDPQYIGRYEGDVHSRDGAYHQGTVWSWLLGPFISAKLRIDGSAEGRRRAMALLDGIRSHLSEAGLGQISEIFDGDAPHSPRGCIAQAWSVAEILRVATMQTGVKVVIGARKIPSNGVAA